MQTTMQKKKRKLNWSPKAPKMMSKLNHFLLTIHDKIDAKIDAQKAMKMNEQPWK